ncbi:MAG: glycosyltransferase family 4 protein [Bacilli bacterium]|nr:glycosyltransferase family 4 protein [Bacilli bacterium]
MKILLHTGKFKEVEKSGVGRAIVHQKKALDLVHIPYTTDVNGDYDIVHINTIFPESLMLAKKSKKRGKKVIFHAHSTEEDFRNSFKLSNAVSPLFKQWLKSCYGSADLLITPTEYSKKLLEKYDLDKEIIAISNGIDLDFFDRKKCHPDVFRKKYGFTKDDKVIMSVGLYIERKGILDFLELARRLPDYKFIWFGYTKPSLIPENISRAIKNKPDNVLFPGYIDSKELRDAYAGCDIYIFPTKEETEGIVLLEALALKTKTIVSDIPIYEGWLKDGVNIYKAKDVDEFESKIKSIIEKKLPDLTSEGYKVAKERDIKSIGYELKKVYEHVLESDLINTD